MGSALFIVFFSGVLFHAAHAVRVPVADGRVLIPADSGKCIATRATPQDVPIVDCEEADPDSDEDAFLNNTIIDLSTPFARCEISPSSTSTRGFLFDCSAFPPVELEKPVVQNRTLTVSEGAVSCEISGLQQCRTPNPVVVNCKGAKASDDTPRFGSGVVFEFPEDGSARCDISAGADGQLIQACVGAPVLAIAEPVVEGDTVTLPLGATNCEVSQGEGDKPVVTCAAVVGGCMDPTFEEGATVDLPAGFDADTICTIEAVEGGAPDISCNAPPKVPTFREGTLFIPEGVASCEVTGLEICVRPTTTRAACKFATPGSDTPTFGENAVFQLERGFSSCAITPGEGDETAADCTTTPPPATILKEKIIGRSITPPAGAVSCIVTPTEEEDEFDVECVGPTEGCNDPEFEEEENVTELPEGSFESCTVTPRERGPFVACSASE